MDVIYYYTKMNIRDLLNNKSFIIIFQKSLFITKPFRMQTPFFSVCRLQGHTYSEPGGAAGSDRELSVGNMKALCTVYRT